MNAMQAVFFVLSALVATNAAAGAVGFWCR